jgi:DNA repair protein RecO (recombination protein O)
MPEIETTAIVLRRSDYRDWDRMLTLFSPEHGRIDAIARGIRRPAARIRAAGEPFATGLASLIVNGDRAALSGFDLTEGFYPLRENYDRLSQAAYALNACAKVVQPSTPDPGLFALLQRMLGRLAYTDQSGEELLARFLFIMMRGEGIAPSIRVCARCGRDIPDETPAAELRVSISEGGVCCVNCAPYGRKVRDQTLRWLMAAERAGLDDALPEFVPGAWEMLNAFFEGYSGGARMMRRGGAYTVRS